MKETYKERQIRLEKENKVIFGKLIDSLKNEDVTLPKDFTFVFIDNDNTQVLHIFFKGMIVGILYPNYADNDHGLEDIPLYIHLFGVLSQLQDSARYVMSDQDKKDNDDVFKNVFDVSTVQESVDKLEEIRSVVSSELTKFIS